MFWFQLIEALFAYFGVMVALRPVARWFLVDYVRPGMRPWDEGFDTDLWWFVAMWPLTFVVTIFPILAFTWLVLLPLSCVCSALAWIYKRITQ